MQGFEIKTHEDCTGNTNGKPQPAWCSAKQSNKSDLGQTTLQRVLIYIINRKSLTGFGLCQVLWSIKKATNIDIKAFILFHKIWNIILNDYT